MATLTEVSGVLGTDFPALMEMLDRRRRAAIRKTVLEIPVHSYSAAIGGTLRPFTVAGFNCGHRAAHRLERRLTAALRDEVLVEMEGAGLLRRGHTVEMRLVPQEPERQDGDVPLGETKPAPVCGLWEIPAALAERLAEASPEDIPGLLPAPEGYTLVEDAISVMRVRQVWLVTGEEVRDDLED